MPQNTIMLLHGEDFTDSSSDKILNKFGDVKTSSLGKFDSCFEIGGTSSDYITINDSIDFQLYSKWTIDFWIKAKAKNSVENEIISKGYYTSGVNNGFVIRYITSARNGMELWYSNGTTVSFQLQNTGIHLNVGVWEHVAIVSTGTQLIFFINGVQKAYTSTTITDIVFNNQPLKLFTAANAFIDEFRISNTARWTANFTPYSDKLICNTITTPKIRYIRERMSGSTSNGGNHWVEIQAINASGTNIALNKAVTIIEGISEGQSLTLITNNDTNTANYVGIGSGSNNYAMIMVDLGDYYEIDYLKIWHYYGDNRSYYSIITEVYAGTWITVNDTTSSTYKETSSGRIINIRPYKYPVIKYLLSKNNNLYTINNSTLVDLSIPENDISSSIFLTNGMTNIPDKSVLSSISESFKVLRWQEDITVSLPSLIAKLTAVPLAPQTLITEIDMSDSSIKGISSLTGTSSGTINTSIAIENEDIWYKFNTTTLLWELGTMSFTELLSLSNNDIALLLNEKKKFKIKFELVEDSIISTFRINYTN